MNKVTFNRRKVNRDFSFKIKMERIFRRDLNNYFNRVKAYYKQGQGIPTIEFVLENHYNRIVRNMRNMNKQNDKDKRRIEQAIMIFLTGKAKRQAGIIDQTTKNKIQQARNNLIAEGILNPTRSDIANVMTRLNKSRITNISVYETQWPFEGIKNSVTDTVHKQMEDAIVEKDKKRAEDLYLVSGDWTSYWVQKNIGIMEAGALFGILAASNKTWYHMGDKRVRPWHRAAGGQTVHRSQPFVVKSELLMYPGDTSLGASMDNVTGCRCTAA